MIIEELVSFTTAKLALEKGFPQKEIYDFYDNDSYFMKQNGERSHDDNFDWDNDRIEDIIQIYAPTQALLQKWLRDVHNIHIAAFPCGFFSNNNKKAFALGITKESTMMLGPSKTFRCDIIDYLESYEEALEKGLQEALKLIN